MRSKVIVIILVCFGAALAQQPALDPRTSLKIEFPPDSPVTLVSADLGDSATTARGSAMVIDLRSSLSLRNSGQRRIRGVTLLVTPLAGAEPGRAGAPFLG